MRHVWKISGERLKLKDLPEGSMFLSDNHELGLKTAYITEEGAIEAYLLDSGEFFWGGTDTPEEQIDVKVLEVKRIKIVAGR